MTKILFEISEWGTDNTLDIEDTKSYMVLRIVNYIKTYDKDGNEHIETKYFPLERCTEDIFERDFEKKYYESNSYRFQYCPSGDLTDIKIYGTRDSAVLKMDHAYIIYEI